MLPSEQFELAIYRWVTAAGLARPVNIPDFYNMPGSNGEYGLVADRLKDLHAQGYIGLFKINGNHRVPFGKYRPMEGNAFFGGGFTVKIAPGGRKFFEALEEKEKAEKDEGAHREKRDGELTTEDALRALERRETFDAATLEELREAGFIKIADVTHMQSRGVSLYGPHGQGTSACGWNQLAGELNQCLDNAKAPNIWPGIEGMGHFH